MPVNQARLTAVLEAITADNTREAVSTAASAAAELAGAREFGLLTIELQHEAGTVTIRNVATHAGALRPETVERQIHQRALWWDRQRPFARQSVLPQLFQADPDFASDAFRFAQEPLIGPKASALCVFEKTGPALITAFVAADLECVPPVVDLAVFHSLATLLFGLSRAMQRDTAKDPRGALSPRERECLLWSARGKTSFEIARILGLSEHTVNHYLVNSVNKLDASNRAHAVIKAILLGAVSVDDV